MAIQWNIHCHANPDYDTMNLICVQIDSSKPTTVALLCRRERSSLTFIASTDASVVAPPAADRPCAPRPPLCITCCCGCWLSSARSTPIRAPWPLPDLAEASVNNSFRSVSAAAVCASGAAFFSTTNVHPRPQNGRITQPQPINALEAREWCPDGKPVRNARRTIATSLSIAALLQDSDGRPRPRLLAEDGPTFLLLLCGHSRSQLAPFRLSCTTPKDAVSSGQTPTNVVALSVRAVHVSRAKVFTAPGAPTGAMPRR